MNKEPSKLLQGIRTVRNIPKVNEKLYKEVAFRTKVSPQQVEEIIKFVSQFTANTIKKGAFETIMIPRFGKFRVKAEKVQQINNIGVEPRLPVVQTRQPKKK